MKVKFDGLVLFKLFSGTPRGDAHAFQIEVINRLFTTKTTDGKENLMTIIAGYAPESFPDAYDLETQLSKLFDSEKAMTLQDMLSKTDQIVSKFKSTRNSFIAVSKEAVLVSEDLFVTKMIQFFTEAQPRVDQLSKLSKKTETNYIETTKFFLCDDRYPAGESINFIRMWTAFVRELLGSLPDPEAEEEQDEQEGHT
jgi:hypothetical protein